MVSQNPRPKPQASDVPFMYAGNLDTYDRYATSIVVWGSPVDDEVREAIRERGIHYQTSMWLLTAGPGALHRREDLRQATVRDFQGEPIVVPWLWDMEHEGTPAWWGCTNSPAFRELCRERVRRAMACQPDGLHIDDHCGTSNAVPEGGCFCDHCIDGFRRYLARDESFDYRSLIEKHVADRGEYCEKRLNLPLQQEFATFHVKAAAEFVRELKNLAENQTDTDITLSVNTLVSEPRHLADSVHATFLGGETPFLQREDRRPGPGPIFSFKIAEALDRPLAATAAGWNWAHVRETGQTELVKMWIAQSYAFGQLFMAPHHQWCYTDEKGTHWYDPSDEIFAPLYRFIRNNAAVFDGYRSAYQVALVHSNRSMRKGDESTRRWSQQLANAGVQFELVLAGDEWVTGNLDAGCLARHDKLLVPENSILSDHQQQLISEWGEDGECLRLTPDADPSLHFSPWVRIEGAAQMQAVLRFSADGKDSAVVHLLNRNYRPESDEVIEQCDVRATVSSEALAGRSCEKATLYAPGRERRQLDVDHIRNGIGIDLPSLGLWTIIHLELT